MVDLCRGRSHPQKTDNPRHWAQYGYGGSLADNESKISPPSLSPDPSGRPEQPEARDLTIGATLGPTSLTQHPRDLVDQEKRTPEGPVSPALTLRASWLQQSRSPLTLVNPLLHPQVPRASV